MKRMKRIDDRPFLVVLSVLLIAVILICGLSMEYGWLGYSAPITEISTVATVSTNSVDSSQTMLVPINTASTELLDTLPGIGPVLAQRIVDYRETHGPFTSFEAIKEVKGIGVLEKIRPYITIEY